MNVKVKILKPTKFIEVLFEYKLGVDTPEALAQEMHAQLNLPKEDIEKIQTQIQ